jgi:hypothetical protein
LTDLRFETNFGLATVLHSQGRIGPQKCLYEIGESTSMKRTIAILALTLLIGAVGASATEVLTFSGFQQPNEQILSYYDGGYGGSGTGPGPNYGIVFGSDALAIPNGPSSNANNQPGGATGSMYFLGGPGDVMDVAGGFTNGFSFFYTSPYYSGAVQVYSGLDGTGTLLENLTLNSTNAYCTSLPYSCWDAAGVSFAGTAESAVFTGTANFIAFSDVTLGSSTPGPVPEPSTLLMFGSGVLGLAGALRRKFNV